MCHSKDNSYRGEALTGISKVLVLVLLREGTRMSGAPRARRLLPKALLALLALALGGVLLAIWPNPADAATTFTVNRTGDGNDLDFPSGTFDGSSDGKCDTSSKSGIQCTLRAAIQEANETTEADTINFGIPGRRPKVKTINVGSSGLGALPIITDTVTIDGYTQRGAKENTLAEGNDTRLRVQLNGANAGTNVSGLEIQATDSTIKGLAINRFSAHGVIIRTSGATGNHVEGNFIGTNASGTEDRGNNAAGVVISFALANTIGGTQPAQRNLISGNGDGFGGVHISGGGATGNKVQGNFIGTNAKGTADLGNGNAGVIINSVPGNTVGGTDADDGAVDGAVKARNVISGNNDDGVQISGSGATGNEVQGNFIGTTADGSGDLGNDLDGVFIADAPNNTVGGTEAGARNTISGNGDDGVLILNGAGLGDATGNEVEGNRIGIEADGNGALGNGGDGVIISSASNNTIGGTEAGAGNAISNNGDDGVEISGSGATGNSILSNLIFSNGGTTATNLGIDLDTTSGAGNGVTANDDKDLDTGANNLQNFPEDLSAIRSNSTNFTTISGTINSNTFQDFTVQCFVAAPDPSGHGEGFIPAGADTTVTTDANGDASFVCAPSSPIPQVGQAVTATATNETTGDTSEFSLNQTVVLGS